MPKIILAPDSFKGTLTARQVCDILSDAVLRRWHEAEVCVIPMADGGEGMTDAYLRIFGGKAVFKRVCGPNGIPTDAEYAILPDGTAVLEMAAAAGLPLASQPRDILHATTYGVGEMLLDAAAHGAKNILLGLGGSATNDGGIGMASALGFTFTDRMGQKVSPYAEHLGEIACIRPPLSLPELSLKVACDVSSPLTGDLGASRVFAPQKGADEEMVERLENAMVSYAAVLRSFSGWDVGAVPGAGAAGGLGAAAVAYLGGRIYPGAELLLEQAGFDDALSDADLVITGEGKMDGQSLLGKVPYTVAKHCKAAGVPCVALCGALGEGWERMKPHGLTTAFAASDGTKPLDELKKTAADDLKTAADDMLSQFPLQS